LRTESQVAAGLGVELNTDIARRESASFTWPQTRRTLPRGLYALVLATALSLLGCLPASARITFWHKPAPRPAEHVSKEPFGDIPKGPLQIFISIDQQKLHLYSDGTHIADSSVATGVLSLPTPLGVFSVIQKQVFHRSNIYSNAPMPYMQRITWSGVALHEGENIGHRASHGCIRMPHDFAVRLYSLTKLGARVIVANAELKPVEFADSHLFVHKSKPAAPVVAPPAEPVAAETLRTAQTVDDSKTTDAASADAAVTAKPGELGLRVGQASVAAASSADAPKTDPAAAAPQDVAPAPPAKPAQVTQAPPEKMAPISIFVSRKEKKLYVRRNFEPLFDAAIAIERPDQPLGTHVFTAMEFTSDNATLRWTVVSLPGEPPKAPPNAASGRRSDQRVLGRRNSRELDKPAADLPPPQTPQQALARIDIPQDVIDNISAMMVPGSSLVVSDQGLGDETGDGTDFIVVAR